MTETKRLDKSVCDSILHEFSNMLNQMSKDKKDYRYVRAYSQEEDRLYVPFYSERIGNRYAFPNLWSVIKLLI